ncbi:MAG: hypothetical protein HY856_13400 [Burkholderiales bacterium]|nr:hypothetical protein [Burkholderiales bacterium]
MKYSVAGHMTVSCYTIVEADSPEEAKRIAEDRAVATLCYRPFCDEEDESWHFESDGEPSVTEVIEL